MENELIVSEKSGLSFSPSSFTELVQWANLVKDSSLIPAVYRGKPADIILAAQCGAEVGFHPLNALHSIAVINGKPSLYGDGFLAVCQNHPAYEWHKETQTEDSATCIMKRRGQPEHSVTFTKQDAIIAGLWGKPGPWKLYPKRMMQMRARAFCGRDTFADGLKGIVSAEEQRDIIDVQHEVIEETKEVKLINEQQIANIEFLMEMLEKGKLEKTNEYVANILTYATCNEVNEISFDFAQKWIEKLQKQADESSLKENTNQ